MNLTTDLRAHKVLFIIGPTAVGKTELSLDVAEHLDGEIVSADSRQIYKYLDIGTAKPTQTERDRVPHHFIDICYPDQNYSAGQYGREARICIRQIQSRHKRAIVVGGSGFYIRALVEGLFAPKMSDPAVKEKWRQQIRNVGNEKVFHLLKRVDPVTAERLHPNDTQRIVRALEVWELSGRPISAYRQGEEKAADFVPVFIGLSRAREILYRRIDDRVDQMIAAGLVEEVKNLQKMGYGPKLNALRTVGYQEVFDYLAGTLDYATMIQTIKQNTRRFAKRQLTWFRRDLRIHWMDIENKSPGDIQKKILTKLVADRE
ncbi:tRNA (adenosine(37)-N6)-dimethylallyltransferase MiaA [candidate division KSB1 bacterium]|nr:tRNA (adenosine(37)-N6)-dimethylallyltransferase MiaA [candidate division KSB1 bacterium]RQW05106.1 MAG: tRNA (adenosine(37)-N6)-dimethylallyltransferase MiaA [candidate division KSB1 bacterium]